MANETHSTDLNDDGQPIGTTTGLAAGAATGAAMGLAGGPVGAAIGGVAGAAVGALTGKGVEKVAQNATLDPAVHDEYWQTNHSKQAYGSTGSYDSYKSAYQTGYMGAQTHGIETDYKAIEPHLHTDYTSRRTAGSVELEHAKPAIKAGYDRAAEEMRLVLHEEQLKVGKREVSAGQVELRKTVHTEQVSVPVELRRENVSIERISAGEVGSDLAADAFQEKEIAVTLHNEEAVVSKDTHVTGGVRLHKTAETATQNVSDTVRKEDVEVVRDGKTVTETSTKTDKPGK